MTALPTHRQFHTTRPARVSVHRLALVLAVLVAAVIVGVRLAPPSAAASSSGFQLTRYVVVQPGDTLWGIAAHAAPDRDIPDEVDAIAKLNNLDGVITPGQRIYLP